MTLKTKGWLKMNFKKQLFFSSFLVIILLPNAIFAQTENLGELNVWTEK